MLKKFLSLTAAAVLALYAGVASAQTPNGELLAFDPFSGEFFFGFNNDEIQVNTIKVNDITIGAFIMPNVGLDFGARNSGLLPVDSNGNVMFSLSDESLSKFWTSNDVYPVLDNNNNLITGGLIESITSVNDDVLVNGQGPVNFVGTTDIGGKQRFKFTLNNDFLMREGGEAFAVYQSDLQNFPLNGLGAVSANKTITRL